METATRRIVLRRHTLRTLSQEAPAPMAATRVSDVEVTVPATDPGPVRTSDPATA